MAKGSFDDLVNEAPLSPAPGTVSLVGTLARSTEPGKFVLTLQGGSSVTLQTTSVKGHVVLGSSKEHMIIRIDVDSKKIPAGTVLGGLSGRLLARHEQMAIRSALRLPMEARFRLAFLSYRLRW